MPLAFLIQFLWFSILFLIFYLQLVPLSGKYVETFCFLFFKFVGFELNVDFIWFLMKYKNKFEKLGVSGIVVFY